MKPSQVLAAYRVASRNAKRLGQSFMVSKTRLQSWGWTEDKVSALFLAIERVDELEEIYEAVARELDQRFEPLTSRKES